MNNKSVVMAASYGGPYGGNFIPSLIAYDAVVKGVGYRTVYIFPDFVKDYAWVEQMRPVADRLYFIPYNQYSIDNIKRIREICMNEHAALVYSRMGGWDITARLAMPNLPHIWHMEMNLDLNSLKQKLKYLFKYRVLGGSKVYHIAVSESTANAINSLGVRNKCVWIPNAINTDRLNVKTCSSFEEPVKLLTFAYQPIIKGLDIALDAVELLNKNGIKYILLISAQKHTFEYLNKRYAVMPDWIKILKSTDDIASIYAQADIMLSPSRKEGFSYALLEAIYSGMPAVYSDIAGTSWADAMRGVYRFRSEDSESLARAIETCASSHIDGEMLDYNHKLITEKYTMLSWAERISDFIKAII